MPIRFAALLTLILAGASWSCAPTPDEGITDDTEAQSEALKAYSNSTFYIVTGRDLRKCAYPFCGGVFVRRVNLSSTVCSDGRPAAQCRALEMDWKALGLDSASEARLKGLVENGQALIRGSIGKTAPIGGKTYDKLVALEAWEARALATPTGAFSRVRQLPLACPACPPYRSELLNNTSSQSVSKLLFDTTRFSATLIKELETTLASAPDGLLFSATLRSAAGGNTLTAAEAYTPFKGGRVGKVGDPCGSRGVPAACEAGAFCKFDRAAICGRVDGGGICTTKPEACIAIYKPVCGCDKLTYGNECEAHAAGMSVDYDGPCS